MWNLPLQAEFTFTLKQTKKFYEKIAFGIDLKEILWDIIRIYWYFKTRETMQILYESPVLVILRSNIFPSLNSNYLQDVL